MSCSQQSNERDPFKMLVRSHHVFFLRTLQWILILLSIKAKFLTRPTRPFIIWVPISLKLLLLLLSSLLTPLPPPGLLALPGTCQAFLTLGMLHLLLRHLPTDNHVVTPSLQCSHVTFSIRSTPKPLSKF